jgi:DNA-binding response OmpR family regulator
MAETKVKRVLIADDEPDLVTMLMVRLRHEGYEVLIARNGDECVALAEQEKPDLILMDVVMPLKNGYDACEEIKKNPKTARIPVVLMTALNQRENVTIGKHLGARAYVTKPFNVNSLLVKIRDVMQA